MPRKLPASYVRKLNEQQKAAVKIAAKHIPEKTPVKDPDSGRLKSFTMICQTCGHRVEFTVDSHGYATCSNCKAIANYRLGHLA